MKLLLIGQAPNKTGSGPPLAGRCGARLASLAGISLDEFLARTERVNLLDHYPGKSGKGDAFPMDEARREAARLISRLLAERHHRPIVLLGCSVAKAFHCTLDLLVWGQSYGYPSVAIAPHPSGVSQWWNDQTNVARAASFWRETFQR